MPGGVRPPPPIEPGGPEPNGHWVWDAEMGVYHWADPDRQPATGGVTSVGATSVGTPGPSEFFGGVATGLNQLSNNIGNIVTGQSAHIPAGAPGSTLNTAQSTEDRQRMQALLDRLQTQAATGGGAWEGALAEATRRAQTGASAVGQTGDTSGGNYMAALRNIGNAQASAGQHAVGQGNILRAQTQQQAAQQLAALSGGVGDLEARQAAEEAAARQGFYEANQAIGARNQQGYTNFLSGVAQAGMSGGRAAAGASDGGEVPGHAEAFGDDERNDTVPAWLSPGEVVLPRSVTMSPDAPERAADFVRSVQAKHGKRHFDDGGAVPYDPTSIFPGANPASQWTGAVLPLDAYNRNRTATLGAIGQLETQAAGQGPSVAPQATQNAADTAMAAALRPGGGGAMRAASETQRGGGGAAATSAEEQQRGVAETGRALLAQRARDLAVAEAAQQAAWRNSMMNAGIGLQQQAQMRGILGGIGQGLMGASGAFERGGNYGEDAQFGGTGSDQTAIDSAFEGDNGFTPSVYGEANPFGEHGDAEGEAHGGVIEDTRAKDFVAALKRRRAA